MPETKIGDVVEEKKGEENLKELVEKSIKWTQVVYEQNQKIKHRITMMVIGSYLRLLLIVVPIIFAVIYLPPLLRPMFEQYSALLGGVGGGGASQLQLDKLMGGVSQSQIQEIMKTLGGK